MQDILMDTLFKVGLGLVLTAFISNRMVPIIFWIENDIKTKNKKKLWLHCFYVLFIIYLISGGLK